MTLIFDAVLVEWYIECLCLLKALDACRGANVQSCVATVNVGCQ